MLAAIGHHSGSEISQFEHKIRDLGIGDLNQVFMADLGYSCQIIELTIAQSNLSPKCYETIRMGYLLVALGTSSFSSTIAGVL